MIGQQASDVEDAMWALLSYRLTNQKRVIPITQLVVSKVTSIASFLSSSRPPRLLFLTADGLLLGYKVLYFPSLLHQVSRRGRDQRQGQAPSESHRDMVGINELTYSDMFQKVKCSLSVRRD